MVNMFSCSQSAWRGSNPLCRWCNENIAYYGKFCSKACLSDYADNHYYQRGKERVLREAPRCSHKGMSPQGAYLVDMKVHYFQVKPPHVLCAGCGECEEEVVRRGDKITINHIIPRDGYPLHGSGCIHHLENLEPLCWRCHARLNQLGNVRERLDVWLEAQR